MASKFLSVDIDKNQFYHSSVEKFSNQINADMHSDELPTLAWLSCHLTTEMRIGSVHYHKQQILFLAPFLM